ncbi:MAG: hypothetical protein ACRDKT_16025 [Actinomycetota bacterium]
MLDQFETSRREKRQAFMLAVALATVMMIIAAPVVEAAVTRIRGTVTAKIKDSAGGTIDADQVLGGAGQSALSAGALDVRTHAGGGGLVTNGDCDGDETDGRSSVKEVQASPDTIITALILAGDGVTLGVSAPGLEAVTGAGPVIELETTVTNPTVTLALGNGLQVLPVKLRFECTGGEGNWALLGQLDPTP